jgi:hypothetical protein
MNKPEKFGRTIRQSLPELKGLQKLREKEIISPELLRDLGRVSEVVLAIIGVTGALAITAAMPKIWAALPFVTSLARSIRSQPRSTQEKIVKTFYYLKQHGYIQTQTTASGKLRLLLTKKGLARYQKLMFDALAVPKPEAWDGCWWCVAADIPTQECRQGADRLRYKLKSMGFCTLQRSMWFYPYDPRNEINTITNEFMIGHYVTVFKACELDADDEAYLRKHFARIGMALKLPKHRT